MLETARDCLEDRDIVVGDGFVAEVDPREHGEENDYECRAEGRTEEGDLLDDGVSTFRFDFAESVSDDVEEHETAETVSCVEPCVGKMLEGIDNDSVGARSGAAKDIRISVLLMWGTAKRGGRNDSGNRKGKIRKGGQI